MMGTYELYINLLLFYATSTRLLFLTRDFEWYYTDICCFSRCVCMVSPLAWQWTVICWISLSFCYSTSGLVVLLIPVHFAATYFLFICWNLPVEFFSELSKPNLLLCLLGGSSLFILFYFLNRWHWNIKDCNVTFHSNLANGFSFK